MASARTSSVLPPPPPPPPCPTDAPAWSASAFDVDEVESLLDDTAAQDDARAELTRLRATLDAERAALAKDKAALEKEKAEHAGRARQLKQARAELDLKVAREVEARLASARAAFAREKAAIEERVAREVDALRSTIGSGSGQLALADERRDDRRQKPSPLARMLRRRRIA